MAAPGHTKAGYLVRICVVHTVYVEESHLCMYIRRCKYIRLG